MSVVAVKRYKDYIEICADGLAIKGAYNIGQMNKQSCKLYTDEKNYIFGSVGCATDGQLFNKLLSNNKDIKLSKETPVDLLKAYDLLDVYYNKLQSYIKFKENKNFDERINSSCFMLIVSNNIFTLYHSAVNEVKEFDAVGAGQDEVLSDLINGLSPTEAVKKSAKANIYISEPITTYRYCLKTGKIEIIKPENKPNMPIVKDKLCNKKKRKDK